MELRFKEYKYKEKSLSFTLKEKEINGISGNHLEEIINIIRLNDKEKKNIFVNKKELKSSEFYSVKKKIAYIKEFLEDSVQETTLEEQMIEYIKRHQVYPKNLSKKLKDSLKIVGLDDTYLKRNFYTLSTSEKKLFQLSLELLLNPEIIILEEPLKVLDMKNRKRIMMVLKKIKDTYQKTIVILSNDPEVLYKETDHLILFKNDKILVEDKTMDVYQRVDFLKRHKVEIPEIVEITYLAKKNKNVKIDYFRDVRDIIKDIYKHV